MKTLICTMGLPRSGKGTWARKQGFTIVNPDSFRLTIYGQRYWGPGEKLVWATVFACVKALFMGGNDTIILDATNTTRAQRDQWQSDDWETYFYDGLACVSAETCKTRAIANGMPDLIPVIERMAGDFEPLEDDEMRFEESQVFFGALKYYGTKEIDEQILKDLREEL